MSVEIEIFIPIILLITNKMKNVCGTSLKLKLCLSDNE